MMGEEQLPQNWATTKLDELISFALGGDWGKAPGHDDPEYADVRCIRASEVRNWDTEKGRTAALRRVKRTSLEKRRLNEGDIIVEISGGGPEQPVGRTFLIENSVLSENPNEPKICTNFFRLIRPVSGYNSKYLNTYLQYFYKSGKISEYQAGSNNLRNLKFNDYIGIEVPLPPLNEQHRIVAKIEELFSELDKGTDSLKKARAQLKPYRQSVLKHAFEGKLTADWREENSLTGEWKMSTLGDCGTWKGGGTPSKQNSTYWENGDVLWVSPKDMKSRKIQDTQQKITIEGIDNSSAKLIETESVLFVVRSGILRRILPVSMAVKGITVNQDMQAMMPTRHNVDFVYWYCQGYERDIRHRCSKDGTTVESIDVARLKSYPIPVPTDQEQNEIINRIESTLSQIDGLEAMIEGELKKSEGLRQSILKKAFSGQLVPQNPSDEPASVLLERIRAEKAAQAKPKTEAKTKKNTKRKDAA